MSKLQITAEDWAKVTKLLDEALDLPSSARARWLDQLDAGQESLKPHLRHLLSYSALIETSDFLETLPAIHVYARSEECRPPGTQPGRFLGPYRLLRELGSGGMGAVWLAERADGLINRPVALKFPRGVWIQQGLRERMARERELLAALEHPGIARLYDAGLTDTGDPYLALEYVEGRALDDYCTATQQGTRGRLRLFLQVIDAVAHAHSKLVIHRDLKPANIFVTHDGQVRLLDFGIGKLLDEQQTPDASATEWSARALTPDYASPEQISGSTLGVATDIYSLGVVLYELLTGKRPYRLKRDSRGALEDAILEAAPNRPSAAVSDAASRRALRGDLDAIVLKALKKTPGERYATAAAFAEDIRRHLAGHPVRARPDTPAYRIRKFLTRHKLAAAAAAVTSAAVLVGSGAALWQAEIAKQEARRAQATAQFIESIFQGVDPNLLGAARPLTALEILDRAQRRVDVELRDEPALRMQLQAVIARSYLGLFEPERARELLTKALANAAIRSPADRAAVRTMNLLMAQALLELTQLDEADRHLRNVFGMLDRNELDATYLAAKVTQSAIEYKRGRYPEASRAAEEALTAAAHTASTDTALLADVHTAIGKATGMLRDTARSLEHNEQAYKLARQAFSGDHTHPKVLEMEHNYAASLIDAGRLEEAVPHLERSLASAQKIYGESSLLAAQYSVRLGLAHMERGELARAIELIERGNRLESAFDVGASPSVAGRLRTLARANMAARRMRQAATHIEAAVAVMRQFDAPFMLRVLEADQVFIDAANGGEVAAAIEQLQRIIAAQDQGESRYKTHLPDFYIGALYLWDDNPSAAVRHLERGVELARAQTRKSDLGEALTQLGYANLALSDLAAAGQAFREGLDLLRSAQVVATPAQADALLGLARVALQSGQETAFPLLSEARAFWDSFAPNAPAAGEVMFWLGQAHTARNEPQQARECFEAATRALRGSPLPTHAALLQRIRTR